jgi:hypothetical protein
VDINNAKAMAQKLMHHKKTPHKAAFGSSGLNSPN